MNTRSSTTPYAPFGVGLRRPHMEEIRASRPAVDFFEVHPENYILDKRALAALEAIRADYPLSLHAVGLSLGSAGGVDPDHLQALRRLVGRLDPFLVSDHLSWSSVDGMFLNDLLPLPLTHEALDVLTRNIDAVQTALGRKILIENPSAYIAFPGADFTEPEFLRALSRRTGCGLLLDVNNVYVSAANLRFDPQAYLAAFPMEAVSEIHLAGHARNEVDGETVLIDDHGAPVAAEVWRLYEETLPKTRGAASLVEWDSNIPPLQRLIDQHDKARAIAHAQQRPPGAQSLAALQSRLGRALLSPGMDPDLAFKGHFSVYRNNLRESLIEALRAVYAGTEALFGDAFFRQSALSFIAIDPPRAPSLAAYGEGLPAFLEGLPACRGLPYLGDVARLEWLGSRVCLAERVPPLLPDALRVEIGRDAAFLCFRAQAGLAYLCSAYPVDAIWDYARKGGEGEAPCLDDAPVYLEIMQGEDGLIIRRLDEASFRLRRLLAAGADLGRAAHAAIKADALFDLSAALRFALADGIFTACHRGPSSYEEEVSTCRH